MENEYETYEELFEALRTNKINFVTFYSIVNEKFNVEIRMTGSDGKLTNCTFNIGRVY